MRQRDLLKQIGGMTLGELVALEERLGRPLWPAIAKHLPDRGRSWTNTFAVMLKDLSRRGVGRG
jgi:hypothetical protein